MDGFTISNAARSLESGRLVEPQHPNVASGSDSKGPSFSDTLKEAIGTVNELQKNADTAAQNLATGRTDNIAEVMIATEKADLALRLMMQVRNKMIDAYQEVMKMQV